MTYEIYLSNGQTVYYFHDEDCELYDTIEDYTSFTCETAEGKSMMVFTNHIVGYAQIEQ